MNSMCSTWTIQRYFLQSAKLTLTAARSLAESCTPLARPARQAGERRAAETATKGVVYGTFTL